MAGVLIDATKIVLKGPNYTLERLEKQVYGPTIPSMAINHITSFTVFAAVFAILLYSFSEHVYGYIPVNIGGGKPVEVRIVFRRDAVEYAAMTGLVDIDGTHRVRVYLLANSIDGYVFTTEKADRAVLIERDMIRAIVFEKASRSNEVKSRLQIK